MKSNLFIIQTTILCWILVLSLISCVSHEQKPDEAFDNYKNEKNMHEDIVFVSKEVKSETPKLNEKKIVEKTNEWIEYKLEIDKKIALNAKKIKELKELPNVNAKLLRNVTSIQNDNDNLRKQTAEYIEDAKVKWEQFKIKTNHDVNKIDIDLKDITINNKK